MQFKLPLALLSLLLTLNGCSTITVNADYNSEYNFQNLHTYSLFFDSKNISIDPRIHNDLVGDRMTTALHATLQEMGYNQGANDNSSFLVTWQAAIESKMKVETVDHYYRPHGYGSPGAYSPFMSGTSLHTVVREYEYGTLFIDILDATDHKLIWRGIGQDVIHHDRSPEELTKRINRAVTEILKQFPPPTPK